MYPRGHSLKDLVRTSPFLNPPPKATPDSLALLGLRRDHFIPITLQDDGAAVTNTRFGSFPHQALLDLPWGTQVRAINVNASRSKKSKKQGGGKKRKRADDDDGDGNLREDDAGGEDGEGEDGHELASSGFVHLLPPTPETWTISLPHRTQVVYTPDYSYVLQRLRVRPGDTIIEAGAGSGSFTHASARAVFSGYPSQQASAKELENVENGIAGGDALPKKKKRKFGKVYSFEFHEPRVQVLRDEVKEHGLEEIVTVTHRDVYEDGFCIDEEVDGQPQPRANAIFLDLPAPWLALKHLTRSPPTSSQIRSSANSPMPVTESDKPFRTPLSPTKPVHICTFSPCIEQVTRTVSMLRQLGWIEIEMVELLHKRIDVKRERVGLQEEGLRGGNPMPKSVDEALGRLREQELRTRGFYERQKAKAEGKEDDDADAGAEAMEKELVKVEDGTGDAEGIESLLSKQQRMESNQSKAQERKIWKEGKLVHRTESELKTHTSYLTFATLPREWTEEDEKRVARKWPVKKQGGVENGDGGKRGRKGRGKEEAKLPEGGEDD
ncbi:tRNA methyltransferase complex GCD14 subunit [Aulographum hederae CBS 113979]|uniref:tRNA (adenine(58)-N(1))-methyltransferase catalytic subunit TRM61 n=1 Tax=Aulographum hederae CBS 113979 TaxID=1176131 RepID=A0A6G1HDY6_9PEZI|nr:tRNA methyltransferase complex GCD14 subunit [Aulographum hederae CBS 113979]